MGCLVIVRSAVSLVYNSVVKVCILYPTSKLTPSFTKIFSLENSTCTPHFTVTLTVEENSTKKFYDKKQN